MKRPTPLLTLLAGLVLGGAVLGWDISETGTAPAAVAAPAPPAAEPEPEAEPSAPESPAAEPTASESPAPTPSRTLVPQKPGSYAGNVLIDGRKVPLALTIAGNRAIAYICDGRNLEAWFRGDVGATIRLTAKNGAALSGAVRANGTLIGQVTLKGEAHNFTLKFAKKPGGLYRATQATRKAVIGWIVQEDGSQTGLATTPDGKSTPAPPLDPKSLTATVDGEPVTAAPADPQS